MTSGEFVGIAREGIYVLLIMGAAPMTVALLVGLAVSLFQALTQIQEATLTFVPKVIAMLLTLALVLPFMVSQLLDFSHRLAEKIQNIEAE